MNKKWNFDQWASSYDKSVQSNDWIHEKYHQNIILLYDEIVSFTKNKTVKLLDIGSGTGNLISLLKKHENIEIIASDPSRKMREVFLEKCPEVIVVDAQLPDLNNLDGNFDIIVSSYVIHHIPHESVDIMIENLKKLCKSDGLILLLDVMFKNEASFLDELKFHKEEGLKDRVDDLLDEYFQYVDQLSMAFEKANFSVMSRQLSKYIWLLKAYHGLLPVQLG